MAIYTFYACRADGRTITFEAFELADDEAAFAQATVFQSRHDSCAAVEIWSEDNRRLEQPA